MPPHFHKTLKDGFGKPLDCAPSASPSANQRWRRSMNEVKNDTPATGGRIVSKIVQIN
jgi:hypothetical protein